MRKSCSVHKDWGDGDAWTVRLHMMGGGREGGKILARLVCSVVAVMVRLLLMLLIWIE